MAGCCLQKLPIKCGMKYLAVLTTATRNLPRDKPLAASTFCSKVSQVCATARAVFASSWPTSVR